MYRKNDFLPAKIVPTDGSDGIVFLGKPKNLKEISQVLDFQRFEAFR